MTLHLLSDSFVSSFSKSQFPRRLKQVLPFLGICLFIGGQSSWAQDKGDEKVTPAMLAGQSPAVTPAQPSAQGSGNDVGINFRERPHYMTDPQRLRRSPHIDGDITESEWDPFYSITEGGIKGTVYCNWDDNYLYIATKADQPALQVIDVDTSNDGWLRGADNLEIVIGSAADHSAVNLAARLLDASNAKDAPAWNDHSIDVKSILVSSKLVNGTQMTEIAIPKKTASLVLRPGVSIGLRVEFLPAGDAASYMPTAPFEPHLLLDAKLVEAHAQAVDGINPYLKLSDQECIAGQKISAKFELRNQTDVVVPIKMMQWSGQGTAENVLELRRQVVVPSLPPMKRLGFHYEATLPKDIAPGSYTLLVTATLANGKQVQSTASFTVVDPLHANVSSDPDPLTVVGTTHVSVLVDIFSAVPDHFRGEVELTNYPSGWELVGARRRSVQIYKKDANVVSRFNLRLPSATPAGDYPVEATIAWQGKLWKVNHVVRVQRSDPPKTSAQ